MQVLRALSLRASFDSPAQQGQAQEGDRHNDAINKQHKPINNKKALEQSGAEVLKNSSSSLPSARP